jgi:shikimate kinase
MEVVSTNNQATVVALTGFMGSGKSTAGLELAALQGWAFVDLDAFIESRAQLPIREIFRQAGEAEFRNVEHAALETVLADCETPTVLALGGGTFVQPRNAELLRKRGAVTVFLELPVEELLRRCDTEEEENSENVRPLAADAVSFRELYERRLPAYRSADIVVDAAAKDRREIALVIAQALRL